VPKDDRAESYRRVFVLLTTQIILLTDAYGYHENTLSELKSSKPTEAHSHGLRSLSIDQISLDIRCSHFIDGDIEYSCDSTEFYNLQFDQCNIDVIYSYEVINDSSEDIEIISLFDGSLVNVFDDNIIVGAGVTSLLTNVTGVIDTCEKGGFKITRGGLLIASVVTNEEIITRDNEIEFQVP
jgi:hypothetical protein